ncbi:ABC transporter ATP-binding protein [Georgenia sp. SYP-B2076]|uniref:ABC transporter ATP-binding protein n=1 Tax=Georgenia sp. SYP-B2076 TaxID=2495881 RepID=UPI001F0B959E|nr:ATP-binding cassette domain-containing protein [Georgenia sp. SYP-B2076]
MPDRDVRLDLDLVAGQVLGVLGANGAGKSTLLGLVAGLVRPASGAVRIHGRTVADAGTWVPPHARRVALLAQEPLLFPHLDALANVAFGPRAAGVPRAAAERVARERLDQVGAADLAGRRPHELSGGQAQRVALARALAPDPEVVLLDEPLSALDVDAAAAMRQLLRAVLRDAGRTAVLVTHDLLDVLAVADVVVVLDGGRVVESGSTLDVLTRPRSSFTASLAGVNLVGGTLTPGGELVAPAVGGELVAPAVGGPRAGTTDATDATDAADTTAPAGAVAPSDTTAPDGALVLHGLVDPACRPGTAVAATFSPRAVAVHLTPPGGSPRNTVTVTVATLEHQGELVRIRGTVPSGHLLAADITPASVASLGLAPGASAIFSVKAAEVAIYPA